MAFTKNAKKDVKTDFVLLARDLDGLRATSDQVQQLAKQQGLPTPSVHLQQVDLSDAGRTIPRLHELFQDLSKPSASRATLVNNAGSLGIISTIRDILSNPANPSALDPEIIRKRVALIDREMSLNVSSVVALNSLFLKTFGTNPSPESLLEVVNISSGAAFQAFPTWSLYCTHKAARKILHEALAIEEPNVRVLNYSPGVINTDMHKQIRGEKPLVDPGNGEVLPPNLDAIPQKMSFDFLKHNAFVSADLSAEELVKLLEENKYSSGESIDFYQRRPELFPAFLHEQMQAQAQS